MKTSEKSLDKTLSSQVKKLGGWSLKMLTVHVSGLPDRLLLFPGGRVAFAETKTTGDKPRKLQIAIHKKLRKLGFKVYVVDRKEVITQIIQDYELRN